jgi:hypothetical protein
MTPPAESREDKPTDPYHVVSKTIGYLTSPHDPGAQIRQFSGHISLSTIDSLMPPS